MHAVRSVARPKLSLAVPAAASASIPQLVIPSAASAASRPSTLPSPSPLTPTARNTLLNQRACAAGNTLQIPAFDRGTPAKKKVGAKKVSFCDAATRIELVSPCPSDYYGEYVKMSREERRWRSS